MADIFDKLFFILIYLYMIMLPIAPSKYKYKSIPLNGDMILALIIIMYLMKILFSMDTRKRFIQGIKNFFSDYLTIFLLMLSLIMVISILYASDKKSALSETVRFFSYVMLFFILKYELHNSQTVDNIMKIYIFVCFLVFSYGILQYFFFSHLILTNNIFTNFRVDSTLENSNNLAAFAILAIFPLIVLFLEQKDKIKKSIYFLISILAIVNIALSQSRNALVALAIGCLILCFLYNYKFIIAFILMGGIAYTIPQIHKRILQITDSKENDSRIKIWKVTFKIIKDHPILGIGNGNFPNVYQQYIKKFPQLINTYGTSDILHPHNIFLKFQSELGILGTIAFLGIFITIPIKLKEFISNTNNCFYKSFYKGFFVSFIAFMLMNMVDNFFSAPKVISFFWIMIAVTQSLMYNSQSKNGKTIV